MFEKIIEYVGFGIFGTQMRVRNADRLVFYLVHIVFKHNMITVVLHKAEKPLAGLSFDAG